MYLDDINRKILDILQKDGRTTYKEMTHTAHLAESTVRERISKMEKTDIIQGYTTIVDPGRVGLTRRAIVYATVPYQAFDDITEKLKAVNGVSKIYGTSDARNLMFLLTAENDEALNHLLRDKIAPLGVTNVEVAIIMGSTNDVPILTIPDTGGRDKPHRRIGRPFKKWRSLNTERTATDDTIGGEGGHTSEDPTTYQPLSPMSPFATTEQNGGTIT